MKKFTLILLALCMTAMLFSAVACTKDDYDDHEETLDTSGALDLETNDGAVTAPPTEGEANGNNYINSAPANDEQGWGPVIPRP